MRARASAAAVYLSGTKLRSTENIYFGSSAVLCGRERTNRTLINERERFGVSEMEMQSLLPANL